MKIKIAMLLGALAMGVTLAGSAPALATTSACASACSVLSSVLLPADAQSVTTAGVKVGGHVVQRKASATASEDFGPGTSAHSVRWYCSHAGAQQIKGWLCNNEPEYQALEMQYMPSGKPSGLCAGVPKARAGQYVTLQKCGRLDTLWVTSGGGSPLQDVKSTALLVMEVTWKGNEVLAQPNTTFGQEFSFTPGS